MEENEIKKLHDKSKEECLKTFNNFDRVFFDKRIHKEYDKKVKRHIEYQYKDVQSSYKRLEVKYLIF